MTRHDGRYRLLERLTHRRTGEPWYKFTRVSGKGPGIIRIRVEDFW